MEIAQTKTKNRKEGGGKSTRVFRTQQFIPPTHPAYIVTPNFKSPHIVALQEQLDKNYIAVGMQTSKKVLSKIPGMPTDKYFLIVDNNSGPANLEGEFSLISKKVVDYPKGNSIKQIIEAFDSYIGLGHFQVTEEKQQIEAKYERQSQAQKLENNRYNPDSDANLNSEKQGKNNFQSSAVEGKKSKVELKQISSRKEQLRVSQGYFFIYDNRRDIAQFKELVEDIKTRYGSSKEIMVVNRIDEYNHWCNMHKKTQHIILMTQCSYVQLSEYFNDYHSLVVYADGGEKIKFKNQENIVLLTSNSEQIFSFIESFIKKKTQIKKNKVIKIDPETYPESVQKEIAVLPPNNLAQQPNRERKQSQRQPEKRIRVQKEQEEVDKSKQKPPNILRKEEKSKTLQQGLTKSQLQPKKSKISVNFDIQDAKSPKSKIQLIKISTLSPKKLQQLQKSRLKSISREKSNTFNIQTPQSYNQQPFSSNDDYYQIRTNKQKDLQPKDKDSRLNNPSKKFKKIKSRRRLSSSSKDTQLNPYNSLRLKSGGGNIQGGGGKIEASPVKQNQSRSIPIVGHFRTSSQGAPFQQSPQKINHYRSNSQNKYKPKEVQIVPPLVSQQQNESSLGNYQQIQFTPIDNLQIPNMFQKTQQPNLMPGQQNEFLFVKKKPLQLEKKPIQPEKINKRPEAKKQTKDLTFEKNFIVGTPKFGQLEIDKWSQTNKYYAKEGNQKEAEMNGTLVVKKPNLVFPANLKNETPQQKDTEPYGTAILKKPNMVCPASLRNEKSQHPQDTIVRVCNLHYTHQIPSSIHQKKLRKKENIPPTYKQINSNSEISENEKFQAFQRSENTPKQAQNKLSKKIGDKLVCAPDNDYIGQSFAQYRQPQLQIIVKKPPIPTPQSTQNSQNSEYKRISLPKATLSLDFKSKQTLQNLSQVNSEAQGPSKASTPKNISFTLPQAEKIRKISNLNKNYPDETKIENPDRNAETDPYGFPTVNKKRLMSRAPAQIENKRNNDPNIGKIYKIPRVRSQTSRFYGHLPTSSLSTHPFYQTQSANSQKDSAKSSNLCVPRRSYSRVIRQKPRNINTETKNDPRLISNYYQTKNSFRTYRVQKLRSLSDIYDLSQYQKFVQDGVVVYRAKKPIIIQKQPFQLRRKQNLQIKESLSPKKEQPIQPIEKIKENNSPVCDPIQKIEILSPKEKLQCKMPRATSEYFSYKYTPNLASPKEIKKNNSRQKADKKQPIKSPNKLKQVTNEEESKEKQKKIAQNIKAFGIQCKIIQQNVKPIQKPQDTPKKNNVKSYLPKNKQNVPKEVQKHPKSPVPKKQAELKAQIKKHLMKNQKEFVQKQQVSQSKEVLSDNDEKIDSIFESIVLYLVQKGENSNINKEILGIKQQKDSVIFYKNDKQLIQQILQSQNVFDVVYIFSQSISPQTQRIVRNYPNCYFVEIVEGQSVEMKNQIVSLPSFSFLFMVTQCLIKKLANQRKKNNNLKSCINQCTSKNKKHQCLPSNYEPKCYIHNQCLSAFHPSKSPQKSNRCYACGHS